jgi:hypothetical protein
MAAALQGEQQCQYENEVAHRLNYKLERNGLEFGAM